MLNKRRFFIAGIGTGVGKTISSAVLCEALKADYWKPVQAGDLEDTDTMKVKSLVSNPRSNFHQEAYRLEFPMSPHASAKKSGIRIETNRLIVPVTDNDTLIIEGAGGLMVPLNEDTLYIDIIAQMNAEVIVISRHYLGSINHTLMSVESLINRQIPVKGILFIGDENKETESIILKMSRIPFLGRIPEMKNIDSRTIIKVAESFHQL
jgi:dethiobiotin synthetase